MKFLLFICAFAPLTIQDDYDEATENVTTRTHLTAANTKNTKDPLTNGTVKTSIPKVDGIKSKFKWLTPNAMLHGKQNYPNELPYVVIKIRDAECYSSFTESSFVIYLAALDFHNHYLSEVHVRSDSFVFDPYTATRTFSVRSHDFHAPQCCLFHLSSQ
ncbi:hypothetical protein Aduo_005464 [Ancylostoma duodenale]